MLGDAGTYPPIDNTPNPVRNPLVPRPPVAIEPLDAVLVTHIHNDHWDPAAAELLAKGVPVIVQPASRERILSDGYADVRTVETALE